MRVLVLHTTQVAVDVSLNGQQFTSLGATYTYHPNPSIAAIEPHRCVLCLDRPRPPFPVLSLIPFVAAVELHSGPVEGGTLLTLHGHHFSALPVGFSSTH